MRCVVGWAWLVAFWALVGSSSYIVAAALWMLFSPARWFDRLCRMCIELYKQNYIMRLASSGSLLIVFDRLVLFAT